MDDYAPFYDWENARTLGRRDVPFWRNLAVQMDGRVLELGCGTGRIFLPLARAGVSLVGIDRSAPMLARARARVRRGTSRIARNSFAPISGFYFPASRTYIEGPPKRGLRPPRRRVSKARTDGGFAMVMAPYGLLQSLLRERDLASTLDEVRRVLRPGGTFGLELVADLPSWAEYRKRVSLSGWRGKRGGAHVTLVETVRQDRKRRFTIFDQEFTERRAGRRRVHRFSLTFRTLSVPQMSSSRGAPGSRSPPCW